MNLLYFLYQLIAIFFLVMAGIAVANYLTFDLIPVLQSPIEAEVTKNFSDSGGLYYRLRFGGLMWIGGVIIALTIAYSRKIWLPYPLFIGGAAIILIIGLATLSGEFFNQRWVINVFGYERNAYLYNFLLCMAASYWLFRRSAVITAVQKESSSTTRDDILDADL